MTKKLDDAHETVQRPSAKPYSAPRLITYGALETLTMSGSMMETEPTMPMMGPFP